MKYCPHCGQLIRSDAVVCPYCGYQQSRVSRDEKPEQDYSDQSRQDSTEPDQDTQVEYSKAKLSALDMVTLIINVLNAGTLFFLGFQGLILPSYISNVGTFVTVILSLFGIITLGFEIRQDLKNRLPIWSALVALIGDFSVFIMIFMFNQKVLLISLVILILAALLFDCELKRTY